MNTKPELSLIIPYYFQLEFVLQTLNEINIQVENIKKYVEVLIIDSNTNSNEIDLENFNKKSF